MAVVPRDELRRRMAAGQVLAGNAHAPIGLCASAVDDLMVVRFQICERHVLTEVDAAEEAEAGAGGDLTVAAKTVGNLRAG